MARGRSNVLVRKSGVSYSSDSLSELDEISIFYNQCRESGGKVLGSVDFWNVADWKKQQDEFELFYISALRPRADMSYCIYALARCLSRTCNWAEELVNFIKTKGHMLNMGHLKDDSGSHAWDYSAWVRNYALVLEERLECFRVLNNVVEATRWVFL
ncbi:hypothetical protein POM88_045140 [Heracleum sosnowskyi]|uniref:AP180 N-terminal homology (ANTH) domain-containing protein n=1 Tax=Heracleum sosnowskyi TaxID=360622 RepID=A0AAD8H5E3_9APIA|nr:hypothetical protein POM88_045140 [Heracleum sosnowskyi]